MGHGPGGLQRGRQRVGLLLARPVALARVPVGRGRPRRHLRRQAAPVLRARAVERARPDPEGAAVRAHQQRGQSRRGRQGVLLLPRQHADALLHEVPLQVPAARVPVSRPRRDEPETFARGVRVRAARHGRLRRGSVLRRVRRVREGGAGRHPHQDHAFTTAGRKRRGFTCCRRCGSGTRGRGAWTSRKPSLREAGPAAIEASHHELGDVRAAAATGRRSCCSPRTRATRSACGGSPIAPLREGCVPRVRHLGRSRRGEPARGRDQGGGALRARRARRRRADRPSAARDRSDPNPPSTASTRSFDSRIADANEFYERITPQCADRGPAPGAPAGARRHALDEAVLLLRPRAVAREHRSHPLLEPARTGVRNTEWFHMLNADVISMPDKWEYPWYAAWDLAFHTVALALVDFDFAKDQLLLMLRSLYFHPNGQIPAYEWNFSDVNPPVHAWATLYLYKMERTLGPGRHALPGAVVPGADAELQLVGEPQGSRRPQRLRRRVPRPRQHRRLRSQRGASDGRHRWNRPTGRPGWRSTASACSRWR